jgi:C4-dicarboxylate-specific signal transduction histidine kinase
MSPASHMFRALPGQAGTRIAGQRKAGSMKYAIKEPTRSNLTRDHAVAPPIPIREILAEVVETLEPAMPQGMRITLNIAPDILVRANTADVFRVLLSILRNAIDIAIRCRKEFHVRITGVTRGRRTSIMISDSGPGLPAAVRYSFNLPVKRPQNQLVRGRGLAIARHLAQINGGTVRIAATGALGTIFEIVLPSSFRVTATQSL